MTTRTTSRPGLMNDLITDEIATSRKSIGTMAGNKIMASNAILLDDLNRSIKASAINGYSSLVNYAPMANQPVHRWFWYREGYSQELVRDFIKELPKGSVVLDPFCGAGTTLIAAKELGLPSVGFDVNPISTLVSRVKTTPIEKIALKQIEEGLDKIKRARRNFTADPKPGLKIIDKLFEVDVLNALLIFRRIINQIEAPVARDFLFVAWLSILEKVSNAYKEGNGIKYKNRKRTTEGYIRVDMDLWANASLPTDRFEYVKDQFVSKIKQMIDDIPFLSARGPNATVYEAGAEHLQQHLDPNSIALAIFSPPYCNCFNYFKMYKVELWMGGFVNSYEDLRKLNRRGLRSHVETVLKREGDIPEPDVEPFAKLLDNTKLWDKRIPTAVRAYFIDMASVLSGLHEVIKPSGKCVIVVGNSSYGGVVVPTDALLGKIAEKIGFKVEKLAVARHLTTSSQQRAHLGGRVEYLRESILVLSKEDPRLVDAELEVVEEIPLKDELRNEKVFLIKNSGLTAGTHKFHRYPGKFIPHVPRWALRRFAKPGNLVLDPFCGSGTTLVEARLHGVDGLGIDVDPIAKLVSMVKTTHIPANQIRIVIDKITKIINVSRSAKFKPKIPTLSHWFNADAIQSLGIIRDAIDSYKNDPMVYSFLLVCFISIIRRSSNADNQTQKTYVSHTKPKVPEAAIPLFLNTLDDYGKRVSELPISKLNSNLLENSNALDFSKQFLAIYSRKVDLIITSPPYLNSVDYVYNQMAEYFWIGDLFGVENQTKQNEHSKKYIGTNRLESKVYSKSIITGIAEIDLIVDRVRSKQAKSGYIVAKYFSDMTIHFHEAASVIKKGGKYICVVGDSSICGEPVLVHELLVPCAEAAGFKLNGRFAYEIRNRHMRFPRMGRGGIVRYDWVLEFEKTS